MSKKLAIEELDEIANRRGGRLLSKAYLNNHTPLLWECQVGHRWKATAKNIRRGAWCHICGGSARLNIEEMKNLAKQRGGRCLSKTYINNNTKLQWKCNQGHVWEATPNSIKSGTWCPECSVKRRAEAQKGNLTDMNKLAKKKGGKCLSKVYVDAHNKLLWRCSKGHQWKATPNDIQQGTWCPFCSGRRTTIKDMKRIAKERGGICLSDSYVNIKTKLLWQCDKGHQWKATPGTIKSGSWCPYCSGNIRLTIKEMQDLAESRGGICLSKRYISTGTKLLWECSESHQWKATPDKIKRGSWCPECSTGLGERICREFFEQLFHRSFPKSYPKWLVNSVGNRMELDGYCESLKIAFEHQGEQHYSCDTQFIKTKEKLKKRQKDDQLKYNLCKKNGVVLIAIPEIIGRLQVADVKRYIKSECLRKSIVLPKRFDAITVDLKKAYASARSREVLSELQAIAKERGGRCLSDTYVDNNSPMLWECKNGHEWEATPSSIKNSGSWCPTCAGRPKVSIGEMHLLAEDRGGRCLSMNYVNNRTKLLWECAEGHTWEARPHDIRNRGRWCPICASLRSGNTQRLNIGEMRKIARNHGGKCLSDRYSNNKTKLPWECKKGHQWWAAPSKIKSGQWCPACAGRPIVTIDDMKKLAEQRSGKCISKTYINNRTKLLWECEKGHRWKATPNVIKNRGSWCPICRRHN